MRKVVRYYRALFPRSVRNLRLHVCASYVKRHLAQEDHLKEEKTEEELARIAERRREQGRKLQEIAAKSRLEKVCFFLSFLCERSHT